MVYLVKTNIGIEVCEKSLKGKSLWFRQIFNGFWIANSNSVDAVVEVDSNYYFNNQKPVEVIYDEIKNRKSRN